MVFFRLFKDLIQREPDDPYSKIKQEKPREFYLDESKCYQYIPKSRLTFENSYLPLYKYRGTTFKLFYLAKVPLPAFCAIGLNQANFSGSLLPLVYITGFASLAIAAIHSVLFCRIAKEINLHEDGDKVEVVYRWMNMIDQRKVHNIQEFRNQVQHPLMMMWSLNPVPKNILAGIETEFDNFLPIYLNKPFGFYLLHGKPDVSHQDLLINALNGVIIDTKAFQNRVTYFKDRYRVIKP